MTELAWRSPSHPHADPPAALGADPALHRLAPATKQGQERRTPPLLPLVAGLIATPLAAKDAGAVASAHTVLVVVWPRLWERVRGNAAALHNPTIAQMFGPRKNAKRPGNSRAFRHWYAIVMSVLSPLVVLNAQVGSVSVLHRALGVGPAGGPCASPGMRITLTTTTRLPASSSGVMTASPSSRTNM